MENNSPIKKINTMEDLNKFLQSNIYKQLLDFIVSCQNSIRSKKISDTKENPKFQIFKEYLNKIEHELVNTPPIKDKMRFGNIAFKSFYNKIIPINNEYSKKILISLNYNKENIDSISEEIKIYLDESFGSEIRIDYGTGHELNFFVFIFCLYKLKLISNDDLETLIRNVFYKYIDLMRKIQLQYNLEPAGSHGVWGLDDYHFLPFLFGAAELVDNEIVKTPNYIHNEEILNNYYEEYMYLNCIKFIKKIKTGGQFFETSPMLNDISGAETWLKIANGMIKMYHGEVFSKFPVMRHLRFGSIFNFE